MWPSRSTSTPHSTGVTAGLPPAGGQRQAVALERDQVLAGAGAAGVEGGLFGAGPGDQIGSGGGGLAIAGQAAGQLRGLAASEAHVDQAGQHAWVPVAGGVVGQAGADGLERDTGGDDLRDVLREQRRRGNSVRSYRLLFSTCYREVPTGLLTTGAQPASGATSAFASFPQVSTLPGRVRFRHWPVSGQWCDLRLCVVVAGRWPAVAGALWRRDGQFVHDALPADAAVAIAVALAREVAGLFQLPQQGADGLLPIGALAGEVVTVSAPMVGLGQDECQQTLGAERQRGVVDDLVVQDGERSGPGRTFDQRAASCTASGPWWALWGRVVERTDDAAVSFAPARTLPPGFRSRTGSISPWRMATVIR